MCLLAPPQDAPRARVPFHVVLFLAVGPGSGPIHGLVSVYDACHEAHCASSWSLLCIEEELLHPLLPSLLRATSQPLCSWTQTTIRPELCKLGPTPHKGPDALLQSMKGNQVLPCMDSTSGAGLPAAALPAARAGQRRSQVLLGAAWRGARLRLRSSPHRKAALIRLAPQHTCIPHACEAARPAPIALSSEQPGIGVAVRFV